MKILVTNDDGNQSTGIHQLVKILEEFGDVYVVCPDQDQSGTSHSLTLHRPLKYKKVQKTYYTVSGTPTDCIHFALHHLWNTNDFDICVSGINHGANIGNDVWYSGTVGGAVEAALNKIPSIAISLLSKEKYVYEFDHVQVFLKQWFETHITELWDPNVVLNMNIPSQLKQNAFRWTRLGSQHYLSSIDIRQDLRGNDYFWIGGTLDSLGTEPGTDSYTVAQKIVSVTPLDLNMTNFAALEKLKT